MKKKHIKTENKKSEKKHEKVKSHEIETKKVNKTKTNNHSKKNSNNLVYILSTTVIILVLILLGMVFMNHSENKVNDDKNNQVNNSINSNSNLDIIAIVNGNKITKSSFEKTFDLLLFFQGIPTSYKAKISQGLYLNQSIEQDLIYNKAKNTKYLVSKDQAKNKLEAILINSNRSVVAFKKTLVNKSFTYDDIITQFAKQLTINNFINSTVLNKISVSDKEQLDYYNQNKAKFTQEKKVKASHILVNTSAEAVQIIDKLNSGANFSELAKKYSIGPSGKNGGDLGYFSKSQMVPEFSNAAFNLSKIGDYTKTPVKSKFGYHIILLTGIQDAKNLTFQEVKTTIQTNLIKNKQKEAIKSYIDNLLKSNDVKILI